MIPVFSNSLGAEELEAVQRVMESRWIGAGPECKALEDELAQHFGVQRVLLTNCATNALYLALRCLGLKAGDEVIVPSIHFVASAGAVLELGGVPIFADVDPHTLNITAGEITRCRTPRTRGVIVNHYGGHPCDMNGVREASEGLWILEDAANAPASRYYGQAVGTLGDAGVWSFDSMKILSMADGGALWLRDAERQERACRLRNLGLDSISGAVRAKECADQWWAFAVPEPSGRSDSNDLLACIGRVQLRKLEGMLLERRRVWNTYQSELNGVGDLVLPPEVSEECTSSYYLYWVQTELRDELARFLYDAGIYTTFRYYPLHWAFGVCANLPMVERVAQTTLCLPLHQNVTKGDASTIVGKVKEFYRSGGRFGP